MAIKLAKNTEDMPSKRQLFLSHVAQTSDFPLMLEVEKADGMYIYTSNGDRYFDLNSGISVSSLGHRHPTVMAAIQEQLDKHLHTMVYGEHIQHAQIAFAKKLTGLLDDSLESVYYFMSGTEAVEGAMKLAKRYTGRHQIISCSNAYHGSTQGAESLRSDHEYSRAFLPLLPGISHITFNDASELDQINHNTACVILEPVQAEAGVHPPVNNYLQKVRARCSEVGALMVLDEIQTGFGRTGRLFAHEKYEVVPDVLCIGKAMGGGMPIAAMVSSLEIMKSLQKNPMLGHITTFGGHPVSCAAALGNLTALLEENIITPLLEKEKVFLDKLKHPIIKEVRSSGLMMAVELTKRKFLKHVVAHIIEQKAIVDYFLFNDRSFRLAPPLIISLEQVDEACEIILTACEYAEGRYGG